MLTVSIIYSCHPDSRISESRVCTVTQFMAEITIGSGMSDMYQYFGSTLSMMNSYTCVDDIRSVCDLLQPFLSRERKELGSLLPSVKKFVIHTTVPTLILRYCHFSFHDLRKISPVRFDEPPSL